MAPLTELITAPRLSPLSDAADASVVNANARLPASPAVRSLRASAEAGVEGDAAWLGPATRALATARAATSVALVEGGEDAAEFAAEVDTEEASRQRRILRGRLLSLHLGSLSVQLQGS